MWRPHCLQKGFSKCLLSSRETQKKTVKKYGEIMRIKSNIGLWLLPLLPFMFISLIFSSGCKEPTNDSQSYIPLTGVWEGTLGTGDSLLMDLVEVSRDSVIGDIVVTSIITLYPLEVVSGERTTYDSLHIMAVIELFPDASIPALDIALWLSGCVVDSNMSGVATGPSSTKYYLVLNYNNGSEEVFLGKNSDLTSIYLIKDFCEFMDNYSSQMLRKE